MLTDEEIAEDKKYIESCRDVIVQLPATNDTNDDVYVALYKARVAYLIQDLQTTRQDLRELCCEIEGWVETEAILGSYVKELKDKYGWREP